MPFQPWAEELYKKRRANNSKDDPTANCIVGGVPRSDLVRYPFKILQVPGMVVILYEAVHAVSSDLHGWPRASCRSAADLVRLLRRALGRRHARGPDRGFNDMGWLDNAGKPPPIS